MQKLYPATFLCALALACPAHAQDESGGGAGSGFIEAVTLEGGPIASKHFQSSDEHFRERHGLGFLKVETKDYGNWGLYLLSPNSVDRTSVGAGYVTDPYVIPMGSTRFEFTGALGLVTGYQDYPLPLLAGQVRFVVYESGPWSGGISMAALPYIMEDEDRNGRKSNEAGIVVTSPFLSIRYQFE